MLILLKKLLKKNYSLLETVLESRIIPCIFFLFFFTYHFFRIPISLANIDSGYFLSIARDLQADGLIPMKDIHSTYTPLAYWVYAIPFTIFKNLTIIHFYYFNLLLVISTTFIFYLTIKNINLKYDAWTTLVFFLIGSFLIYDIKLELIAFFLISIAFYFILKYVNTLKLKDLFIGGLFIGLSALTKQYALLLVPMAIIFSYAAPINEGQKIKRNLLHIFITISLSIFIVLLGFIFIYTILLKVDPKYLLTQTLGRIGYNCIEDYGIRLLTQIPLGLKYYAIFIPYVFMVPFLLFFKISNNEKINIIYFIALIALSLLPFYFQIYPHYFFFGFIPVFLFGLFLIQKLKLGHLFSVILMFPVIYNLYSIYSFNRDYAELSSKKEDEIKFYAEVQANIPPKAPSFVQGKKQIYFQCNLRAIDNKNISYAYVPPTCIEEHLSTSQNSPRVFYYIGPNKEMSFKGYSKKSIHIIKNIRGYKTHYVDKYSKI